ncbi:MAG: EthD domain-containing protein [Deltaproteobacteria bacterium]|nr:EthD domain-containing protein [Deltaproteobacteria bacterium]MBW2052217.1 EthD domain-containing protein [Deltaproteobacteria bacterium]MBW2139510.1 EthD domain-containing protein [Deltaproteobacteria bacterium]MBW2322542.1 EthD domain-containing protein [Deltaproteobacteria bacterium]
MIKLVFCLRRLPHLTREEFQKYWLESHGPLVRKHSKAMGVKRYVQVHTTLDDTVNDEMRNVRGGPEAYDGVAELWWESFEALAEAYSKPEAGQAAEILLEDERRFIDLEQSPLWWTQEHVIVDQ